MLERLPGPWSWKRRACRHRAVPPSPAGARRRWPLETDRAGPWSWSWPDGPGLALAGPGPDQDPDPAAGPDGPQAGPRRTSQGTTRRVVRRTIRPAGPPLLRRPRAACGQGGPHAQDQDRQAGHQGGDAPRRLVDVVLVHQVERDLP